MISDERTLLLEEELLLVRHSGEIPEVALHASVHYLTEDPEGPGLVLADDELRPLQEAALARYQEIILRDLEADNRDLSPLRGIGRAICNWERYQRFSEGIGCPVEPFRRQAAEALLAYLQHEAAEVHSGTRSPSVNCATGELHSFARTLGLEAGDLPPGWDSLCARPS